MTKIAKVNCDVLLIVRDSAIPAMTGAGGVYSSGLLSGILSNNKSVVVLSKTYLNRYKLFEFDKKKMVIHFRGLWFPKLFRSYLWALELLLLTKIFKPKTIIIRPPGKHFIKNLNPIASVLIKVRAEKIVKVSHDPKKWVIGIEKLLEQADKILCETVGHKNHLDQKNRKKAIVIPNGIDYSVFNYAKTISQTNNTNNIVILGSVDAYRRSFEVCDSFMRVSHEIKHNKVLKVIGSGPLLPLIEQLVKTNHFENEIVQFAGKVEHKNIPSLIKNSALGIVLPDARSIKFTSPLKLLEFLAMGTPVLTTKKLDIAKHLLSPPAFYIEDFNNDIAAFLKFYLTNVLEISQQERNMCVRFANKYSWNNYVKTLLK